MTLRLVIDGAEVKSLDDVHVLVAGLPGLPDWFGRNLDALAELAYFLSGPLAIVVKNNRALHGSLGPKWHDALIATLEDVRDSKNDDPNWHPVTLAIKEYD